MTLTQVWGLLLILMLCPILGGLPLIRWITRSLTGKDLAKIGTGNVSVSAAFYHGGQTVGILAVCSEALKGIAAVLLARYFFPADAAWEIVALMALVMGRYWRGKGAGTTNVVWGYIVHDWVGAGLIFVISGAIFILLRERRSGKLGVLVLIPLMTALRHPLEGSRIGATVILCALIAWIYQKIPDDLELPTGTVQGASRQMFRFFQGDRAIPTLNQILHPDKVGAKAATLSQLSRHYPVPPGWVLPPGDDPAPLIELLNPSAETPFIVRSSAIGEDSELASAAGQYESIAHVTSKAALEQAILRCQNSYNAPNALQYRQDQGVAEQSMAVLVQVQVQGVFSGVAFSRDPIARQGDAVVIEALPGMASSVVSGQVTPEQYRVIISSTVPGSEPNSAPGSRSTENSSSWIFPDDLALEVEGRGEIPPRLIQQVAYLARHLEEHHHGIPQDLEWSYDGQQLWVLQSRPITTLLPIWTRKIAAEVIPGFIHPLTWSVNRPLTCGVWGDIFTVVLGDRARGLNFAKTATLHHSAAYFNASLLGQTFQQMGLPAESLEFLTRGAKFSKPPLGSTLRNVPGLWRLGQCAWRLEQDFSRDVRQHFDPAFALLSQLPESLPTALLFRRIEQILDLLKRATYYSIMAPLSLALWQALLKVEGLDQQQLPEVASLRSLQAIAARTTFSQPPPSFTDLASTAAGQSLLQEFDRFLQHYGYLSDVATDIAVPRWKDSPQMLQNLLMEYLNHPGKYDSKEIKNGHPRPTWKTKSVQRRLDLKGRVTTVYSKLLAELRWSFVAMEQRWLAAGLLAEPGDIFFLTLDEIKQVIAEQSSLRDRAALIAERKLQLESDRQATPATLVYGNDPPRLAAPTFAPLQATQQLQGIGASPGQAEGWIVVVQNLQSIPPINRETILVVPYTDSGWSPLLAQAGGLIAEVGGQLSHGAIVAREYGIPAIMNISHATQKLQNGQRVRMDGRSGKIDILQ
ncbi:MAG: pyruvate phosphate dikinase PEP/pyruvate-binding protein [Leptolyngbyaceae cyanobacterium CSU_1_4]|nr:pyruvate phosphate dikinase PEP/pyruvate-binding protein [Leptolyngbyaceae cyanobacterium CSU_1_4]